MQTDAQDSNAVPGKIIGGRFIPVAEMSQGQLREIIDSPHTQQIATLRDAAQTRLTQMGGGS